MWALFQKEISGFFSNITGYLVIIVFLIVTGMLIWVFPWSNNILDGGYSTLNPFFIISPWVLLFLIPAICMRSFSQEKKDGTLELLYTRPISTLNIVLSKFLAAFFLVIISLVLTLPFYISVILLGDPVGNIDHGATWGSYVGLLLLAASYVAIGIFASSLTDNIIVSFLAGIFFCAWMYIAFTFMGNLFPLGGTGNIVMNLGMDVHFQSLSRGVIDSRDLTYFISVIIIFILLTNLKIKTRN